MRRSPRRAALPALLLLAFALRLGTALAWAPPLEADAADYHGLATRLAAGEGYVTAEGEPTSWRPPGYPAFLAGVYAVAGPSPPTARIVQAGIGTAAVAATYVVGTAAAGPAVGLVAAALAALDPAQVAVTSRLLSEGLFTLLLLAATACLVLLVRTPRRPLALAAAAGVLLGASVLTRGALVAYPVVAAALLLFGRRSEPRRAALLLAATALVLLPWTARNHAVHDAVVPVATQMGGTFYASQNPAGGYVMGVLADDAVTRRAAALPETEASRVLLAEGVRSLLADPGRIPRLELLKALYFWVPLDWEVMPWYGSLNPVYAFVLVWCGVAAVALRRGRREPEAGAPSLPWPVWLPVLYFFALALVFYGSPRFRMPVEPLLAVAAGVGLVETARSRGRRFAGAAAAGSAAAVLLAAVLAEPLKDAARSLLVSIGLWG